MAEETKTETNITAANAENPVKRKRGRPKGSKNKPKPAGWVRKKEAKKTKAEKEPVAETATTVTETEIAIKTSKPAIKYVVATKAPAIPEEDDSPEEVAVTEEDETGG